jgi:hypothetical protein
VASAPVRPSLEVRRGLRDICLDEASIDDLALDRTGNDVAGAVCDPDKATFRIDEEFKVAKVPPLLLRARCDLITCLRPANRISFSGMEHRTVFGLIGASVA